jgi:hypothetical protein
MQSNPAPHNTLICDSIDHCSRCLVVRVSPLTFRRNILPSVSNIKLSKELTRNRWQDDLRKIRISYRPGTSFLSDFLFCPEHGNNIFLRNIYELLSEYTALYPSSYYYSYSLLWEPQTQCNWWLLTILKADQKGSSDNNSDLYAGGSWFISRPGNRISSLKYFVPVLSPTEESRNNTHK